ncbi:MAG: hypothetical protein NZ899_09655 [Thermoguttaceae bacterium]|nr:hypothetical protein [Thermoguttaceae bacterium]MDW8077604.1 hypothetical protein [Thermoguttaceae bacterium]
MHHRQGKVLVLTRTAAVLGVVIIGLFASGCGRSGPKVVPVSGVVLVDGQPIKLPQGVQAFVQFVPAGAPAASGEIDPQSGRFTLTTFEPGDGCVVGQHKVAVIIRAMVGTQSVSLVDEKYAKPETSGITVSVDGPTDKLEIKLQGPLKRLPPGAIQPLSQDPNIM